MAEGWDDACMSGMQLGTVFLPDAFFFFVASAKSGAFLFHGCFFDLCCCWWLWAIHMRPGAAQPSTGIALSQSDLEVMFCFSAHKQVHKRLVWMSEPNDSVAVLHVSCLSVVVIMWIKVVVPIEKGSAVFYSQIIFPVESVYFLGSFKIVFPFFFFRNFLDLLWFFKWTVSSVVLLCTCVCAWTVIFLYLWDRESSLVRAEEYLVQKKHSNLNNTVFTCVPNLMCAVCGAFREGKSTSLWCHEPPSDANGSPDWNLGGTAGEPGPADSCCKCCCVISRFIHRGSLDILVLEILCTTKVLGLKPLKN